MLDPRRFLEFPPVYNFFQGIVGANEFRRQFMNTHVIPRVSGGRLLEIGCGPGTMCRYVPENVSYIGCDVSARYIEYAQKQFAGRGQFFATPVGHLATLEVEQFDVIIALGLLHHLNDGEIITLCDEVLGLLRPGGSFITGDPCITQEQSRIGRFIAACDRGKYIRFPEQYRAIIEQRFTQVRQEVKPAGTYFPAMSATMIATNAVSVNPR